ncbi:DUF4113 domain-containing protein [Pseudomonas syringae pv. actinidiae]|uniref:DinB/UmuC family translesion DNA polymerase n=1 Tax=Pseudomonas syringae TaxID=317 RepID=UPI000BB534D5|nr:DUF4113 domain-containing protein [Pseudomonas syringae]PBK49594.1 hypothetical protein BUE61_22640 [Pseudomonas syringae pv. actinidiae]PBK54254.1 hypothetical protein BUE60_10445 [Pseudomonas syringae pv. actinidiae]RJX53460.1 DUF4113 domain-containing protein [Pseudomonas syringae pv. actinidiae]RJX55578.1 DUF4113 domain-containing protein [Pseudomonas syringae pv. actinidiae]RJX63862.1 DUF4113 domain-containing protein [Pseudomonas syringae pv. actinidiae]
MPLSTLRFLIGPCADFPFHINGDISDRVMRTIANEVVAQEIYSVDECFVDLTGVSDVEGVCRRIRAMLWQRHSMPVGIGISTTKTLSKVANWRAKNSPRAAGVLDLVARDRQQLLLAHTPIDEVWGVGRKLSERLKTDMGIETALGLARADRGVLQDQYGVVMVRTSRELDGEQCFDLELNPEPSKMIGSSKMFGCRVRDLHLLQQALATYTSRCAEKLRAQGARCKAMSVSLSTSPHDSGPAHYGQVGVKLAVSSDDTRVLVEAACAGLESAFVPDRDYCRVGIVFTQLEHTAQTPADLFACPQAAERQTRAMEALDTINQRFGRNTLHTARVVADPAWKMRSQFPSPHFTTRLDDLLRVR